MPEHMYVDRGIIKWAPFDALVGYHSLLTELKHNLGKTRKPSLSDDQYEVLNQNLHLAYAQNLEIEIAYFHHGYVAQTFGVIRKMDWIEKIITLGNFEKIRASDILEITIINATHTRMD